MSVKRQPTRGQVDIACKVRKVESGTNDSVQLNEKCVNDDTASLVQAAWASKRDLEDGASGLSLSHYPFPHCVLPDLVQNEEMIEALQQHLLELEFAEKNNDLYQFHQTQDDLKSAESQCIKSFREQLTTRLRDWLIKVTGIPLNDTVDMFSARYTQTDVLLCHDDELEGRRIAYIYYLVHDWKAEHGGSLDLFSVDENVQPVEIVKSIVPVRNSLVFFEVSPGSYHQVSEVLTADKLRWSIGGWFHGPPIQRPTPYLEAPRPLCPYGEIDDDVFFDWINPVYLGVGNQGSIQEKFEMDSEIELQDFLMPEKYEELLQALKSDSVQWNRRGPPNKRHYDQADEATLPQALQTVIDLLRSDAMFLMLSNFTGLKFHELAGESSISENEDSDSENADNEMENKDSNCEAKAGLKAAGSDTVSEGCASSSAGTSQSTESTDGACEAGADKGKKHKNKPEKESCSSRCRSEVRRWSERCYTLVHDTDTEGSEFALDAVFYVGCPDWQAEYGGFTSYIAKGEDEELLTVTPKSNALALVYRDKETLKFVKYLNIKTCKMENSGFYDVSTVYYEKVE